MSTGQISQTESTSLENTLSLAAEIGSKLRGGEVVELVSDLGGGKTTFVKGLAKGIGSQDLVRSPSFTLSNQYIGKQLILHHFDFYRLDEPGIIRDELVEVLNDQLAVITVEWANIVEDVLPEDRLTIRFEPTSENKRRLTFEYPDSLKYLINADYNN